MSPSTRVIKSVVLTGGPAAGKTVACAHLRKLYPQWLAVVPEAATQVYRMLNTRWTRLDVEGRRDLQRRIYELQLEQEDRLRSQYPDRVLLLDRGTVDGAAYWPDGPDDYWRRMGTTLAAELGRYDAVVWLESSAAVGCYRGMASNACRFEDAAEAVACGQRLSQLWRSHPGYEQIPACRSMAEKLKSLEQALARMLCSGRQTGSL